LLKAVGRPGSSGLSVAAQSITTLAVGLVLVFSGWGARGGALAYLGGALAHLAAAAWWSRDLWRRPEGVPAAGSAGAPAGASEESARARSPHSFSAGALALLRESAPLALSGAFIAIYFRIDAVLITFFHGQAAVGLYGGAHRFFEGLVLVSAAYRSVIYPVMARAADGPAEALAVLCRKSLRLHLMFTIGIAVFVTFQASAIIAVLLGEAYAPAAPALAILIWGLPSAFMADTLLHLLTAQRRQSAVAVTLGLTAAFNVAVNLVVIPRFSFLGSSAVAVVTEALGFGLMFFALGRSLPKIGFFGVARAPLLAGMLSACALAMMSPFDPGGPLGLVLMGLFATTAYMAALVVLGALGRTEFELVRSLLPERPGGRRERRT